MGVGQVCVGLFAWALAALAPGHAQEALPGAPFERSSEALRACLEALEPLPGSPDGEARAAAIAGQLWSLAGLLAGAGGEPMGEEALALLFAEDFSCRLPSPLVEAHADELFRVLSLIHI